MRVKSSEVTNSETTASNMANDAPAPDSKQPRGVQSDINDLMINMTSLSLAVAKRTENIDDICAKLNNCQIKVQSEPEEVTHECVCKANFEPIDEVKLEPTSDSKLEPSNDLKAEPSNDLKAEPSNDLKAKPSNDLKAEPSNDLKAEPSNDLKAEPSNDLKAEPSSDLKAEPSSDLKAEPSSDLKAEPSSDLKAEPSSDLKAEPSSDLKAEPTSDLKLEPTNEVKLEPVDDVEPTDEAKLEPLDDVKLQSADEVKSQNVDEWIKLEELEAKYSSDSDSSEESESESAEEGDDDVIARGLPKRDNFSNNRGHPYVKPNKQNYKPNIVASPIQQNFGNFENFENLEKFFTPLEPQPLTLNIPPLEEQRSISTSSQLLLSGGSQISNVTTPEVNDIIEQLTSDVNNSNNGYPLEFTFDDLDLSEPVNEETLVDLILDFENANCHDVSVPNSPVSFEGSDQEISQNLVANSPYSITSCGRSQEVRHDHVESLPNSPYSITSSGRDQEVLSPSSILYVEDGNNNSMYHSPLAPSPLSDYQDVTVSDFTSSTDKCVWILPKPTTATDNSLVSGSRPGCGGTSRKTGPRNPYLKNLTKLKRDAFHKRILKMAEHGLGKVSRDGFTILHTLIATRNGVFAIYFGDRIKDWMDKNPNMPGLKGIKSLQSFVNARDLQGRTALYLAAMLNEANVAAYLLDRCQADISLSDYRNGDTPFHLVCKLGEASMEVLEVFLNSKFDRNLVNKYGRTALHEAVYYHGQRREHAENGQVLENYVINNVKIVRRLLQAHVRIDVQDANGMTPIHLAIKNKSLEMLEVLYVEGTWSNFDKALNMVDENGKTPMGLASDEIDNEIRQELEGRLCVYAE